MLIIIRLHHRTTYVDVAYWCHLSNMIEPSVCGGDAVLCQITLNTDYNENNHYPIHLTEPGDEFRREPDYTTQYDIIHYIYTHPKLGV